MSGHATFKGWLGGICGAALAVAASLFAVAPAARADTLTTLYSFAGGSDGAYPDYGPLVQSGSILYGTTTEGGSSGLGTIFQYNLSNSTESVLHSFPGGPGDAYAPAVGLTAYGTALYGVTYFGGSQGAGALFQFNTSPASEAVLHSFGSGSDGNNPNAQLIRYGDTLFGTTVAGGSGGAGTLFTYNLITNTETVLHNFTGSDGAYPTGLAISSSGSTLWGTTNLGGSSGLGTIFQYNLNTNTPTTLASFTGVGGDGARPFDPSLVHFGNSLYGTAEFGGAYGDGTIFTYNMNTNQESTVYSFGSIAGDGLYPFSSLVISPSGEYLYGETTSGGAYGQGAVFQYDLLTNTETILYSFTGGSDGADPYSTLLLSGSTLYGETYMGGASGDGTLFAIDLATPEPSSLVLFSTACGALLLLRRRQRPGRRLLA
jgi:uncharacterized repeat protein (TIGR03803 family)